MAKDKQLHLKMASVVREALDAEAESQGRSPSNLGNWFIVRCLRECGRLPEATKEAAKEDAT